jgi:hypothetical protein
MNFHRPWSRYIKVDSPRDRRHFLNPTYHCPRHLPE